MHQYEGAPYSVSPARRILGLEGLSASQIKLLSGNAMHLMTQMSWILYVFSHIRVRQQDGFDLMPPSEHIDVSSDSDAEAFTGDEKRQRRA